MIINIKPITLVIGILLSTLGCSMMLPSLYELYYYDPNWSVFAISGMFTLFIGVTLAFASRGSVEYLSIKEAFLITVLSWVVLTAFGAIPFYLSTLDISYTDAFFETMSGITTTGSTVLSNLDETSGGILLWRSLLQWMGGIGIIVMALAVLPMLQVGGMQIFRAESFDTAGKILPKATDIAGYISLLYIILTILCAAAYYLAGMNLFDAVNHALTTISTGGLSTHDSSIGFFDDQAIETICIVGMILGSLPFGLLLIALNGNVMSLLKNAQIHWFLTALALFTFLAWRSQAVGGFEPGSLQLRDAAFNIVSIMTGTGYSTVDYTQWSSFAVTLFFIVMFIGGCAGSTSCGIKIFRFQVIYISVKQRLFGFLYPHGTYLPRYEGKPMADDVPYAVMSFMFLFLFFFCAISLILSLQGYDIVTAMSATGTAMANVGPGLGPIVGPSGNFSGLESSTKWLLSFAMLLGRLELFPILVLFLPAFWRD